MSKTMSRYIIEATIITGLISILIGVVQKLTHLGSIYKPLILGMASTDFLNIGQACFLFAVALAVRRILKHIEFAQRPGRLGQDKV